MGDAPFGVFGRHFTHSAMGFLQSSAKHLHRSDAKNRVARNKRVPKLAWPGDSKALDHGHCIGRIRGALQGPGHAEQLSGIGPCGHSPADRRR